MSDYWTTIGEVAQVFDGPHATPKKIEVGPYFLSISSLEKGALDLSKSAHVSEKDFVKWTKRVTPQEGDVLFSYETRLGDAAIMPAGITACLGRRMGLLRPDTDKVIPEYLLYAYLSPAFQEVIRANTMYGATVNRIALKDMPNFPIRIPPLEEQWRVVAILKALDGKIELNRQTNQTLEHMAQAIFKSWFVDFEPTRAKALARAQIAKGIMPSDNVFVDANNLGEDAQAANAQQPLPKNFSQADADQLVERAAMAAISGKSLSELDKLPAETLEQLKTTAALFPETLVDSELGEIPDGWDAAPLGNYLEIKRGGSPRPIKEFIVEKGLPWTKIADATSEPSPFIFKTKECIKEEGLKKTVLLKKGTLILSNSATPGLPKFLELDACIHDGWLHFPEKQLFSDVYLYQLFLKLRKELVAQGNGSVFTNLKTDILRNQVVVVPCEDVIGQFDNTVALIFSKLKENCVEINTISEIRDVLLPKLLSGELKVS